MESIKVSSADVREESELFVTDLWDDARYLLMRTLRLITLLISEAGCVCTFLMAGRSAVRILWDLLGLLYDGRPVTMVSNTGNFLMDQAVNNKWPWFFIWVAAFSACWFVMYAAGLPYRYSTKKPGLNARRCHRCKVAIVDTLMCSNCSALRPQRVCSLVLLFLSGIVTAVFAINDLLMLLLGTGLNSKGK